MQFDWRKFTEEDFADYCARMENDMEFDGDYIGSIHVGDLCFDLVVREYEGNFALDYDLYILGIDDGYAYTNDGQPYSEDGGGSFEDTSIYLTYVKFKKLAEGVLEDFIYNEGSCHNVSLIEKANSATKIW